MTSFGDDEHLVDPYAAWAQLMSTVAYEDAGDRGVMASIPELSGVLTQGATRTGASAMISSALRDWMEFRPNPDRPDRRRISETGCG